MKKTNDNLIRLNCIFIMSLLISNVVAGKIVSIFGLVVPGAVVSYAITFLCTDVIGEIWGKEEANKAVKNGLVIQILSLILIFFALKLKPADFAVDFSNKFDVVLGQNARIVIASMIAYIISQANDVFIFHKLKEKHGEKNKWIRNNASTLISQLIDTIVFITIAFYNLVPNLLIAITNQYIIKGLLALVDTPVFYFLTKTEKRTQEEKQNDFI